MNLSAHWPISNWDVPTRCRETQPKHSPRTRISSHFGKTPILTFPSLSKPRPSSQNCSRPDVHSEMIRADHEGLTGSLEMSDWGPHRCDRADSFLRATRK